MYFIFINKNVRLNNSKTRTTTNAKISIFVFCVEVIIYLSLRNLHDCTFNGNIFFSTFDFNLWISNTVLTIRYVQWKTPITKELKGVLLGVPNQTTKNWNHKFFYVSFFFHHVFLTSAFTLHTNNSFGSWTPIYKWMITVKSLNLYSTWSNDETKWLNTYTAQKIETKKWFDTTSK